LKKNKTSPLTDQRQTICKSNRFVPDEETKKFYEKPTESETGFWTSEDYTFRDMIAKDLRDEIEDEIAGGDEGDESDDDSELADYADRADMDNESEEEHKKTIVERFMIPSKLEQHQMNEAKPLQTKK
jgi:hypothetical protein